MPITYKTATHSKNPLPAYQRWRSLSFQFHDREGDFAIYQRRDRRSFVVFRVLKRKSYVFNGTTQPASQWLDIASSYTPDFREYATYDGAQMARQRMLASCPHNSPTKAKAKIKAKAPM